MLKIGQNLSLVPKAAQQLFCLQVALDEFDRDSAIEFRIVREINLAHPAFGDELDDFVAFEILAVDQCLAASIQRFRGDQRSIQEAVIFSRLKIPQECLYLVEDAVGCTHAVASGALEESILLSSRQCDSLSKEFVDHLFTLDHSYRSSTATRFRPQPRVAASATLGSIE